MIHNAFNKSVVAQLYYRSKGKKMKPQPAIKKFIQDKAIDKHALALIMSTIFAEQKNILK